MPSSRGSALSSLSHRPTWCPVSQAGRVHSLRVHVTRNTTRRRRRERRTLFSHSPLSRLMPEFHEPTTCSWSHYSIEGEPLKLNQVEQRPSELRNKMRRTDGLSGRTHITHNSHCYYINEDGGGGRVGK